jgi:catechol 2,3-dioxygenase-like lactoylglutathione lyase family enzyme
LQIGVRVCAGSNVATFDEAIYCGAVPNFEVFMRSRLFAGLLMLSSVTLLAAQGWTVRPKITGISHIAVYTSNPAATEHFYTVTVGAVKTGDPENPQGVRYMIGDKQWVEVLPLPADAGINRLDHVAFTVGWPGVESMRKFLKAKGWAVPDRVTKSPDNTIHFEVLDPEGNRVEFTAPLVFAQVNPPNVIGHHIIHVGFLVHDRAKEDTFYRALLGFNPYWFGGMQDDRVDWVSQQVTDGHDWLEYMLTSGPSGSGIPKTMSQHNLGVLNHFSIGENSVDDAYATLKQGGRLEGVQADKSTKIGKDGKGQFNMYDPDETRVELMNFHATEKPCCSPFTAPDPAQ